jgi:hypothetical protein
LRQHLEDVDLIGLHAPSSSPRHPLWRRSCLPAASSLPSSEVVTGFGLPRSLDARSLCENLRPDAVFI